MSKLHHVYPKDYRTLRAKIIPQIQKRELTVKQAAWENNILVSTIYRWLGEYDKPSNYKTALHYYVFLLWESGKLSQTEIAQLLHYSRANIYFIKAKILDLVDKDNLPGLTIYRKAWEKHRGKIIAEYGITP